MRLFNFIGSIIFFAITIYMLVKLDIPDSSIVIALIGALATFVVIGNYAQVKEIETKFRSEVKQVKEDYNNQTEELKRKIEAQIEATESALQKRANSILLHSEINNINRTFYTDEGLFDDKRRIVAFQTGGDIASMYKMSFIVELDRSFEALKKVRELQNKFGYDIPNGINDDPDLKKSIDKIVVHLKKILVYIKDHSLKIHLDAHVADSYMEIIRGIHSISNDDMALMIQILQSLSLPSDADHPANTSS